MAQEYLVKDTSLIAIADEIRVLSGKTGAMGLDAMANTINTENSSFESNLSAQDSLISQIQSAVNSLPEAGGSSSGGSVETCTLRITNTDNLFTLMAITYDAVVNSEQTLKSISGDYTKGFDYTFTDAMCGGYVFIEGNGDYDTWYQTENAEGLRITSGGLMIFKLSSVANGISTIDLLGDD